MLPASIHAYLPGASMHGHIYAGGPPHLHVRMQEDEGYVCGQARIPLLDLARGYTRRAFTAPLLPYSTIRGAASLDWAKRPGNYVEVRPGPARPRGRRRTPPRIHLHA